MSIETPRNDAEFRVALLRIEQLMTAKRGTPEGCELDKLVAAVEAYEIVHCDLPHVQTPDPELPR